MPSSTSGRASFDGRVPDRADGRAPARWRLLLAVIAAGPLAWAAQLEANYVMSYVACEQRQTWMLHLCSALALLAVGAALVAVRRGAPPADNSDNVTRFMAAAGVALCSFFLLVILATEIPVLVVPPCTP